MKKSQKSFKKILTKYYKVNYTSIHVRLMVFIRVLIEKVLWKAINREGKENETVIFTRVNKAETCSKGSRDRGIYRKSEKEIERKVKRNLNLEGLEKI